MVCAQSNGYLGKFQSSTVIEGLKPKVNRSEMTLGDACGWFPSSVNLFHSYSLHKRDCSQ